MPQVIFRTLDCEYRLVCPDDATAQTFAFLKTTPELPGIDIKIEEIPIQVNQGYYRVVFKGHVIETSALFVIDWLHTLCLAEAVNSDSNTALLKCVTVVNPCDRIGRVIFIISSRSRASLVMSLVQDGIEIEGDEHLVIRTDGVIAKPARFRIGRSTAVRFPALADEVLASPSLSGSGDWIHAVDPGSWGRPWVIRQGRLDHVVVVQDNPGGRSLFHRIAHEAALKSAALKTILPDIGKPVAFANLRGRIMAAKCHGLRFGDGGEIGALLKRHLRNA